MKKNDLTKRISAPVNISVVKKAPAGKQPQKSAKKVGTKKK